MDFALNRVRIEGFQQPSSNQTSFKSPPSGEVSSLVHNDNSEKAGEAGFDDLSLCIRKQTSPVGGRFKGSLVVGAVLLKSLKRKLTGYAPSHVKKLWKHDHRTKSQTELPLSSRIIQLFLMFSLPSEKNINILQSSNRGKQTFPSPPIVAYKRSPSLRELLVRSMLRDSNIREKPSPGVS